MEMIRIIIERTDLDSEVRYAVHKCLSVEEFDVFNKTDVKVLSQIFERMLKELDAEKKRSKQ